MPIATDVKIFRSTDAGAPTFNGAAGALASLLHACLVTGYNTQSPSSVTRDGDEVTVTYGASHGHVPHQVLNLSGANETGYNGNFRITEVTTNTLKYKLAAGVTPATPATGTISTKMAPAGWTRPYSGTNKAVFKGDVAGTGCYLRVDDTNSATRRGVMRGYISMTDVDTGTEPFPISAPFYWYKSGDDSTSRIWMLVADSRLFYFGHQDGTNNQIHAFGDIISYKPGDAYHCILSGSNNATTETDNYIDTLLLKACYWDQLPDRVVVARAYSAIAGSACSLGLKGQFLSVASGNWYDNAYKCIGIAGPTYPHPVDNGFVYGNLCFQEGATSSGVIRGIVPGLYEPWHDMSTPVALTNLTLSDDVPFTGRRGLLWRARAGNGYVSTYWRGAATGCALIDCTGPWR